MAKPKKAPKPPKTYREWGAIAGKGATVLLRLGDGPCSLADLATAYGCEAEAIAKTLLIPEGTGEDQVPWVAPLRPWNESVEGFPDRTEPLVLTRAGRRACEAVAALLTSSQVALAYAEQGDKRKRRARAASPEKCERCGAPEERGRSLETHRVDGDQVLACPACRATLDALGGDRDR